MLSIAARAMWAAVLPRVSPMIKPRAEASHTGAPNPVNAGTNTTPPVSGTLVARRSISLDFLITPSPSRNHCTTEPPVKTLPSNANVRSESTRHATVVSN